MAKRLGERLVEAGLVTTEAVEKALDHQKITGHKLGDCLVDLGLLQEAALLRFLAAEFQTRFVTADKLAKAKLPSDVLDKLPVRMAEAQNVLPLAYDSDRKLLSIVAAEPQNKSLLDEIALVTGVSEVYAYIGLRSAIAAAIRKHYYGDPTAFATLESGGIQAPRADASAQPNSDTSGSGRGSAPSLQLRIETDPRLRTHRSGTQARLPTQMREALSGSRSGVAESDFIETINILVGLLEQERPHHRGHSAQLARQATIVGRRMGMAPRELASLAMAAYLHDLGKPAERHYTLASNAANADWKSEAKRLARAPTRLFEAVHLPVAVNTILAQLYEAYDGSGTPQGTKGEEISLGARILSTVDSFLDLTKNPSNAHGKALSKAQALDHLRKNAGALYDPVVADIVGQVQSGELLRHRIVQDGRQVLIAESDEATRTDMLESVLRLGLVVHAFSTLEGALDALAQQDCDVLVLSLRFGIADVTALLQYARTSPESSGLPILVLGEPDNSSRDRLLMAGASAVTAPSDTDKAAAMVKQLYEDRILHNGPARVVRGSYDELPLTELLKTLAAGRKSGRLHLRHHSLEGYLHLEHGKVVYASYAGQTGESAMQALLQMKQADFQYDPDSLLLELPHLDKDLDQVVKELGVRRSATA
ncbi:HD domain-containing phosphohydrolase [Hyalangium rubrum]|uniref:HD domain-containing phosphohydrolase n=1 Tax=Hyalangium rubrum TaxID=3103134 RepID=A0ABU5GUY0_9BACT|nr:HD domain-containing phosphohydrolase [Hyalangium sp. s54d21]MDY7224978.1 HD domain-containing phosphohydrolase [Hyalangium sp. s54d21]